MCVNYLLKKIIEYSNTMSNSCYFIQVMVAANIAEVFLSTLVILM